jgi:hypothetical protein
MSIYKQALQQNLRFATSKGVLSTEQLFQLTLTDLTSVIKTVRKTLKNTEDTDDLAFLESTSTVDKTVQLQFDILKDVYLTKKEQLDEQRTAKANKEHNEKILALIADKKEDKLKNMSEEELLALLK